MRYFPLQFDMFNAIPRFATFDDLIAAMMALADDPLAGGGTKMVIYRGNPRARLMIIGEAPGAEEDQQGKPFVGKSGQLLDQILRGVHLDPAADVFVTNAVFRRPPNNRMPTPEEIAWYRPFLLEIIRLVDPAVILLVGAIATRSILDEKRGITQIRGQWFPWNGRLAMPIFHPAYLLRNPSREPGSPKALTWRDIQVVRRRVDELAGVGPSG